MKNRRANFFSFNNPYGACKRCEGYGKVIGIDEDLVIPDKSKSIYEGAIAPWRGEKMREWNDKLISVALKFDFPIHRQYNQLTEKEQSACYGQVINISAGWMSFLSRNGGADLQNPVQGDACPVIRGKTTCPECKGSRLRQDASYVKIDGKINYRRGIDAFG